MDDTTTLLNQKGNNKIELHKVERISITVFLKLSNLTLFYTKYNRLMSALLLKSTTSNLSWEEDESYLQMQHDRDSLLLEPTIKASEQILGFCYSWWPPIIMNHFPYIYIFGGKKKTSDYF